MIKSKFLAGGKFFREPNPSGGRKDENFSRNVTKKAEIPLEILRQFFFSSSSRRLFLDFRVAQSAMFVYNYRAPCVLRAYFISQFFVLALRLEIPFSRCSIVNHAASPIVHARIPFQYFTLARANCHAANNFDKLKVAQIIECEGMRLCNLLFYANVCDRVTNTEEREHRRLKTLRVVSRRIA